MFTILRNSLYRIEVRYIEVWVYLQFVQPIISSIDKALFQILTSVMSPECSEQSELLSAHRPTYMMSKKFEGTFTFFKRSSTKSIFVTWPSLGKKMCFWLFFIFKFHESWHLQYCDSLSTIYIIDKFSSNAKKSFNRLNFSIM